MSQTIAQKRDIAQRAAAKRVSNSECPHCHRFNAYFKTRDGKVSYSRCRYCKFEHISMLKYNKKGESYFLSVDNYPDGHTETIIERYK